MAASTKTMLAIVTGGYRRLGLLRNNETLEAEEAAIGLSALNGMMHNWRNYSVDIEHTSLDLADTFPLDEKYDDGVSAMLAVRVAGENGDEVPAQTARSASECWTSLLAEYGEFSSVTASFDAVLINLPSQRKLIGN